MTETTSAGLDIRATIATRNRYQRIAPLYDAMESMMERRNRQWRQRLWSLVRGPKVLEIGVGTGKNIPFYRPELAITALDLTPGMLERAKQRAAALSTRVQWCLGDVQSLDFPDGSFDSAVATFVFCSVPNPLLGMTELRRVVRPGGQILLLEHMRSANRVLGALMDILNPLIVRTMGANVNRRTLDTVREVFQVESVEDAGANGIVRFISAGAR